MVGARVAPARRPRARDGPFRSPSLIPVVSPFNYAHIINSKHMKCLALYFYDYSHAANIDNPWRTWDVVGDNRNPTPHGHESDGAAVVQ
jgi:hypothetical protein